MFPFELYEVALVTVGLGMLGSVWLPRVLFGDAAVFAVVPLLIGVVFFWLVPEAAGRLLPDPLSEPGTQIWEKLTEAAVVVSLVGAGLRVNRRGWRLWSATTRLLVIAMPLTILAVAVLGAWAGLPLATAVLLGAVLAPTDPVLASDVQADRVHEEEHDVRFVVTSEAGLNDGLAFPFTYLAIALAAAGGFSGSLLLEWALWDLLGRCAIGLVTGAAVGWLIGKLLHTAPRHEALAGADLGSLALCMFFLAYGVTEILQGYGFIAAFVSAYVVRREDYDHAFNDSMGRFIGHLEHVFLVVLLVLLGGAAVAMLDRVTWPLVLVGLLLVLIVRPAVGWVSLLGHPAPRRDKALVVWFGVRGLSTVYYMAYAMGHADFEQADAVWVVALWSLLLSALVHGLTATSAMRWLERREATG